MEISGNSRSSEVAVLLLHGLGGSPVEMSFIKSYLEQEGCFVSCPVLPGHMQDYRCLNSVTWQQYVQVATQAFFDLKKDFEQVYVSGICLGALLSLHLAIEQGTRVAGVIPISTTLFQDGWGLPFVAQFPMLIRMTPFYYFYDVKESFPFGVRDPSIRKWLSHSMSRQSKTHYSRVPYKSVWEMHRLASFVRVNIARISCPILAIHPKNDEVASLKSFDFMKENLDRRLFQGVILENSFHLATLDADRHIVAQSMAQFCVPRGDLTTSQAA